MPGMVNWPAPLAILAEVFLAMLPGGIIGIERITANGRVTLLTLIVLRGVEFLERRINKSTDER